MATLQGILAACAGKRIVVVGDVMLDEYAWGEVRRISPEAPVPVVEAQRRSYTPGGAANVAANVLGLGGVARLGGAVGDDPQAGLLCTALREAGIDIQGLAVDPRRPTTTKTRIIAHNQQVVRLDMESRGRLDAGVEDALLDWFSTALLDADACVLSDYDKGVVSARLAERVIRLAQAADKPVIVDPKGTEYAKYRGASVITPNVHEVERALRCDITGDADFAQCGRRLAELVDGSALLVTRGAQGMSLFRQGTEAIHIPAAARAVFDVTGAGDTVVSTLALALAAGAALEDAARLANTAAGIVVGKVGTATVTQEELLRDLWSDHASQRDFKKD